MAAPTPNPAQPVHKNNNGKTPADIKFETESRAWLDMPGPSLPPYDWGVDGEPMGDPIVLQDGQWVSVKA